MPALGAGIHVLKPSKTKDVDGRDKPGHDVESASILMRAGIAHSYYSLLEPAVRLDALWRNAGPHCSTPRARP